MQSHHVLVIGNKCFNFNTFPACCTTRAVHGFGLQGLAAEDGILHFELANIPVGNKLDSFYR